MNNVLGGFAPATVASPDMISMEIRVNLDISISLKLEVPCRAEKLNIGKLNRERQFVTIVAWCLKDP